MAFAELAQQQRVVRLLQRSLERGRLGHAYLFTGERLGDLETLARTLAKTLNCLSPASDSASGVPVDCCEKCSACRKINADAHADVLWVRPESKSRQILIEQMREVMHAMHLKPMEARHKVGIVVAADRMNERAANSFLKTLEEPPADSVLILATTEPQRLLETIVSRCLRLRLGDEVIVRQDTAGAAWLKSFVESAAASQKGLQGRYRLLGILLGELARRKAQIEKDLTAQSPLERFEDLEPELREQWEQELAAAIEAEYRRQRSELIAMMHWWLRDVWLHCLGQGLVCPSFPEAAEPARTLAARLSRSEAWGNLRLIEQTQHLLSFTNVQEALALEVLLLKLRF
jgi:DNA polymerase-3 subunit delta'